MDRGYIDFERLLVFTLCSAFFVARPRENLLLSGASTLRWIKRLARDLISPSLGHDRFPQSLSRSFAPSRLPRYRNEEAVQVLDQQPRNPSKYHCPDLARQQQVCEHPSHPQAGLCCIGLTLLVIQCGRQCLWGRELRPRSDRDCSALKDRAGGGTCASASGSPPSGPRGC